MNDENLYLFCDTETTGFAKTGGLIQDGQARVCQIGLLLTDSNGKSLAEFCSLIKPDGWKVHEGAQKVHGFSTEYCERYGLGFKSVFSLYSRFAKMATTHVAHNSEFDKKMMEIEEAYYMTANAGVQPLQQIRTPWFCTMKTNTHITGGKWPKLSEAVKHYLGRETTKAHDAMGDVKDCRDVFFAMRQKNVAA